MVQVKQDTTPEQALEIHRQSFHILRPQVRRMKEFLDYHEKAVKLFSSNLDALVRSLGVKDQPVPDDAKLLLMVQILDVLVQLDSLKDIKVSLQNDFARFKR